MKLLSIIIPVYNSEKYLRNCLNSVVAQTYSQWECLLIDDGSTDHSSEICKSYSERDSRFKYLRKKNGGVADTRNYGLERVQGEYVSFVDNDDMLHPMIYQYLIDILESTNSEVSCCNYIKDFRAYDEVAKELLKPLSSGGGAEVLTNREDIYYSIVKGNQNNGIEGFIWNKVYRKSILDDVRFNQDIALVDDADFSLRLFCKVQRVVYTDKVFYHWMQHETNQTTTGSYVKYANAAGAYEDMVRYVSETIDNDNTLSILKSQSLIWNINACKRGVREQCLSKQDKLYYKAIIEKYAKYGKYYNKKVRLKIFMIVHMFGLYEVYAHFK